MKCDMKQSELLDYYYDELNNENRKQFELHLAKCDECETALNELKLTSAALKKWEVPDPKLNMVFVAEKVDWTEKVKDIFHSVFPSNLHPAKSVAYGFAAVFMLFSFTNFEASYDSETGSFGISTSIFGKSGSNANEELLLEQLQSTQQRFIDVLIQERLEEESVRQRDEISQMVSALMQELDDRDYRFRDDLNRVGIGLQTLYEVNDRRFEDVKDLVYQDILLALQTEEIKKEN